MISGVTAALSYWDPNTRLPNADFVGLLFGQGTIDMILITRFHVWRFEKDTNIEAIFNDFYVWKHHSDRCFFTGNGSGCCIW